MMFSASVVPGLIQPLQVTAIQPGSYIGPKLVAPVITPVISTVSTETPWYKTWWGVGGLLFGATLALGATVSLVRR